MNRLDAARSRFEAQWLRLHRSVQRETGAEPRWSVRWLLAGAAVLLGFWAGSSLRRSRQRSNGHRRLRGRNSRWI